MKRKLIVFSDLDGCLLNKQDYSFQDAIPTLDRLKSAGVPVILASSKTEVEMRQLAEDIALADAPLICENGGVVFWSRRAEAAGEPLILGTPRQTILDILQECKSRFAFTSFADLGVAGVAAATDLSRERAAAALQRSCTEPLVWQDDAGKLEAFAQTLADQGLTFTRGGRFWHVAGNTHKGAAMQEVLKRLGGSEPFASVAIGDSPIDQSMLDCATYPIGIPTPAGVVQVSVPAHNGRTASVPGAAGWAECVGAVLDEWLTG